MSATPERILQASWAEVAANTHAVDVEIDASIVRACCGDVMGVCAEYKTVASSVTARVKRDSALISLTLQITDLAHLHRVLEKLRSLREVRDVYRVTQARSSRQRMKLFSRKYLRLSFSQYAEDVMLSYLGAQRRGFYVDVGAWHPRDFSNTYKLYLKGWNGITIEPNPDVTKLFERIRPRDVHVPVGISSSECDMTYQRFKDSLLNSFDPEWQKRQEGKGNEVVDRVSVKCFTLTDARALLSKRAHRSALRRRRVSRHASA